MARILEEIIKESTKPFFKELMKTTLEKAAHTAVSELIRARIDVWRRVKIKREFHDMDKAFREEYEAEAPLVDEEEPEKTEDTPEASEETSP